MLIFEVCVVKHGSENGHQRAMCLKGFALHAQILLTILGSKLTLIGNMKC